MSNAIFAGTLSVLLLCAPRHASADDVPVGLPLCEATFGSSGGQNADHDLDTNSALVRADGGALRSIPRTRRSDSSSPPPCR